MAKKQSKLKKLIILAVFIAIAGGVIAFSSRSGEAGIEVSAEAVTRGDITAMVTATGRIFPKVMVAISSEVPGEIVELPVQDGQMVKRGDMLVRVNPDTLEAQVKQQQAGLASTRASSATQRANLLQAELDLKRIEDLAANGFVPQSDLDQARTALEAARASHESSLFQIERQEMQLEEAQNQLDKATLYAPMDGTIIQLSAELGDRVVGTGQFAGTEIMRLANLDNMEVRVDVSEVDIISVKIGNEARIEVDALPGEVFEGVVSEIANSARTLNDRSQEQQTTFEVRIELQTPGSRIRPGMTATADILTESVSDVVKAPLGSVVVRPRREVSEFLPESERAEAEAKDSEKPSTGRNGRRGRDDRVRVVFVMEEGKAMLRIVETGIADRDYIEIKSGLSADEQIITGSYRALTRELANDSAVRLRKEEPKEKNRS